MAAFNNRKNARATTSATAADIARYGLEATAAGVDRANVERVSSIDYIETDIALAKDQARLRKKVAISVVLLVILSYFAMGFMGADAINYRGVAQYAILTPVEVARALWANLHDFIATHFHLWDMYSTSTIEENFYGYWGVMKRPGIIGITILCAALTSLAGMLYQSVFRNPIAGPSMLGVSSGVSLGTTLLVMLFGAGAATMIVTRYVLSYSLGIGMLVFIVFVGKRAGSRGGSSFNIINMMLIGSVISQGIGYVITFITTYIMDPDEYAAYYEQTEMLSVDTSLITWIFLIVVVLATVTPVWYMRFKMNLLAFSEEEVRVMGINDTTIRTIALICGAVMVLAAQIHSGQVAMISTIVPFLSRAWFGCEFKTQFIGNVCISSIFMLICRMICDAIVFPGETGVAIGTVVSVLILPVFLFVMARKMRGWE